MADNTELQNIIKSLESFPFESLDIDIRKTIEDWNIELQLLIEGYKHHPIYMLFPQFNTLDRYMQTFEKLERETSDLCSQIEGDSAEYPFSDLLPLVKDIHSWVAVTWGKYCTMRDMLSIESQTRQLMCDLLKSFFRIKPYRRPSKSKKYLTPDEFYCAVDDPSQISDSDEQVTLQFLYGIIGEKEFEKCSLKELCDCFAFLEIELKEAYFQENSFDDWKVFFENKLVDLFSGTCNFNDLYKEPQNYLSMKAPSQEDVDKVNAAYNRILDGLNNEGSSALFRSHFVGAVQAEGRSFFDEQDIMQELTQTESCYRKDSGQGQAISKEKLSELDVQPLYAVYADKQVGDRFEFGRYPQGENGKESPVTWKVLRREADYLLIIAEHGLDCKPYHEEDTLVCWAVCSLRSWLNGEFYSRAFNEHERSLILPTCIANNSGPDTFDSIFLLSLDEVKSLFADDYDRQAVPTDYAAKNGVCVSNGFGLGHAVCCPWWLRSHGINDYHAALVCPDGSVGKRGHVYYNDDIAVRPAFKITL